MAWALSNCNRWARGPAIDVVILGNIHNRKHLILLLLQLVHPLNLSELTSKLNSEEAFLVGFCVFQTCGRSKSCGVNIFESSKSIGSSLNLKFCKFMSSMYHLICRKLLHHRIKHTTSTIVRFLETQSISTNNSNLTEKQSLTVSFLTRACGLSWESAISAYKSVHIESTEKPDSVLELLRSHGFTENHIAALISRHPPLILADAEKTLRPKIEFFESLGIVGPDLPRFLCSNKQILLASLKNQIIPTCDFLKTYTKTNEKLVNALKQCSRVVACNIEKVIVPNIKILRAQGVPESHIGRLIMLQPRSLMLRIDLFEEVSKVVKEMGFDPGSRLYLLAVRSMSVIGKENWKKKKEALTSFGWSKSEFESAFRVQPMLMICSEKKIRELMDFFLNKAGFMASDIAKCPNLFLTSLEKRIIPRCSVLQVLMSKGLIEKNVDVIWALNKTKKSFETRYVTKYKKVAPDVIKAYQGEIGFQGFTTKLQDTVKSKQGTSKTC